MMLKIRGNIFHQIQNYNKTQRAFSPFGRGDGGHVNTLQDKLKIYLNGLSRNKSFQASGKIYYIFLMKIDNK